MKFDIDVIESQHRRVETGIEYLERLFDSDEWPELDEDHRFLLVAQHSTMQTLEVIFRRRIELLEDYDDADASDVGGTVAHIVDYINDKLKVTGTSKLHIRIIDSGA